MILPEPKLPIIDPFNEQDRPPGADCGCERPILQPEFGVLGCDNDIDTENICKKKPTINGSY